MSASNLAAGKGILRYEHDHPDPASSRGVKELGNIPDNSTWRFVGRQQEARNPQKRTIGSISAYGHPKLGYAFIHSMIDNHSLLV